MTKAQGVHHIAFSTADMKGQIEFFSDVLAMPLVAIFPMHGVPGGIHAFLEGKYDCLISFVQLPAIADIEIEYGKTHAGNGALPSAPGTMQHLIRSRGVNVLGPIDHGMCRSMYFAGPEGLTLEVATSDEAIDPKHWLDPKAAAEVGIDTDLMARFAAPEFFARPSEAVPQPAYDADKPHMVYPEAVYQQLLKMSDEEVSAATSVSEPPVP